MAGGSRPPPGRAPRSLLMLTSLLTGEIKWRKCWVRSKNRLGSAGPSSLCQAGTYPLPSLSHKCTRHPLASYTVLHIEQALKSYLFPLLASCHLLQADPLPAGSPAPSGCVRGVGYGSTPPPQHPPPYTHQQAFLGAQQNQFGKGE